MAKRIHRFLVTLFLCGLVSVGYTQDWLYTVQPGDTVWDISHTQLKDWRYWDDILKRNNIRNAATLRPGTKISIPLYVVREEASEVRVEKVVGKVEVMFRNKSEKLPLKPGISLGAGDRVITGESSTALLILEDQSSILLRESSELEFTRLKTLGGGNHRSMNAQLRVNQGRMNMDANPAHVPDSSYEIFTVSANSAVRGTGFRIGVEKDSSRTEVLEGLVSVGNAFGKVDVPRNFGTVAQKDSPPIEPVELLPAPDLETFPALIRYLPTVVSSNSIRQARSYRVQIARDQEFLEIMLDRTVKERLMVDQRLEDGDYFLRVRGVDANGLEGNDAVKAFRVEARPEAPMVRSPLPEHVLHAGTVDFSWAEVEGVDSYVFELAHDDGFTQPLQRESLGDTHATVDISDAGEYVYRLSSVTAEGRQGPPGKPVKIRVLPVPAVPEPKPPAVDGDKLRLAWQAVDGVANYQVQLATDTEFQELVVDEKTVEPGIAIPRPVSGYYYFRLRSIDMEGYEGGFSTPQRFEVKPASYLPMILFGIASVLLLF
ncbi:MAG TPA: LysM peptidoglycan-binding domain-containing protein [Chromatiaceae bacterium]|nr:LysM peptidoglycan-binding domain-containing protein [Chromatiaceae bacterium]